MGNQVQDKAQQLRSKYKGTGAWLDKELEQVDPQTFRMPILTLNIVGIQPTLMERLLLDRQLLGHRLNPLKIEIEIYQLQKQLSLLLRMLIPTQIELLVIMLLVGHLFIFFFFYSSQFSFKQKIFVAHFFIQYIHFNY